MKSGKVRAKVSRDRDFRAFAELSYSHWVILENAKADREGWFHECLTANILAAFKVEAYFNHIGPLLFQDWRQTERTLSKRRKLENILAHLKMNKDDADERFQTLDTVFDFRDAVAHARTESLQHAESIEEGDIEQLRRRKPLAPWEALCTLDFAKRAYDDTESLIREIHAAAGLDETDLLRAGHSYSLQVLEKLD